jgi:hypothetical protein
VDLLFGKEIEQMITFRNVEALGDRLARIRARASWLTHKKGPSFPFWLMLKVWLIALRPNETDGGYDLYL